MKHIDDGAIVFTPAASAATSASQTQAFDTLGFDQANIYVMVGTVSTSGETLRTIAISESDTVTSASSMTDIVAFAVGTTTSATVPNSMPAITALGVGAVMEFQVDLKARKRYLGIEVTPGSNTANVSILSVLSRAGTSKDTAALKSVGNKNLTTSTSCALVVSG